MPSQPIFSEELLQRSARLDTARAPAVCDRTYADL